MFTVYLDYSMTFDNIARCPLHIGAKRDLISFKRDLI